MVLRSIVYVIFIDYLNGIKLLLAGRMAKYIWEKQKKLYL